jgi:hypothetical protein
MFATDNDGAARDADWRHPERTWQPTRAACGVKSFVAIVPAPRLGCTARIKQRVNFQPTVEICCHGVPLHTLKAANHDVTAIPETGHHQQGVSSALGHPFLVPYAASETQK